MAQIDLTNSHYLNEQNRLFPTDPKDQWQERDADYNTQFGILFGSNEDETLTLQGWRG